MGKLTLADCNAMPINTLFLATITCPLNSNSAQNFLNSLSNDSEEKAKLNEAKQQLTSIIEDAFEDAFKDDFDAPSEEAKVMMKKQFSDLLLSNCASYVRTTVVHKRTDGTFIEVNGYGNLEIDPTSLTHLKPFADYYTEGTFRFLEFPTETEEIIKIFGTELPEDFATGIYCDVDSTEPMEKYGADVNSANS